ncbi:MAG: FtsX-like permease family protein [Verrucomicrobia bacterium]|nr:FtsX-like permease family protein [Verrucomicrobiota bacterium]MDA1067866.1 FtsX-like permease family protein [Verrucomicrobiota bacterium]
MDTRRYILQSLWHFRNAYLGVFLGSVLGAMVLLGALFSGSSVKESLRRIGENRIGQTTHLITGGDRFFREQLASDLEVGADLAAAPVLFAKGVASKGRDVANQVQLVGVTSSFWKFAPEPLDLNLSESNVAINGVLAERLGLGVGDTLIIRFQRPGVIAGNAPVAGADDSLESVRCTVERVLDDASFGRFSLETTQVPQPSVFMPIKLLQEAFEFEGRANLLLLKTNLSGKDIEAALKQRATLTDYQISLDWLETAQTWEVKSERVFIDSQIGQAILDGIPRVQPVTSYLVNGIKIGENSTPYSIGSSVDPKTVSFLPDDLAADEVVLNSWVAEDLNARVGDFVELSYYQTAQSGLLVEQSSNYTVRSIIPIEGQAADRDWMPNFPGISEAEVPSDWDAGLPLEMDRIRDKDEDYWEEYRGTPKVFLPLEAGQNIWSTRWGDFTALRIPRGQQVDLEPDILDVLRPEMNQLLVQGFRSHAQASASSAVDFGGLFVGMSFFLILAALGLVAMLFQFCLLQRNREAALLSSLGIKGKQLMRWRLGEGILILIVGCVVGLPLAAWYTKRILSFLETIWAGQTSASTFVFHADPMTISIGVISFLVMSLIVLWLALRRQAKQSLSIRLKSNVEETTYTSGRPWKTQLLVVGGLVLGISSVLMSGSLMPAQGAFYMAGFSLLIAGLGYCRLRLLKLASHKGEQEMDPSYLGKLNISSRVSRSLTVVGLIASAVFMVLSVASFRKHVGDDWLERSSGTGGFALLSETTTALNLPRDGEGETFEIFENVKADVSQIVPIRKGAGDNVNCFNLNTTSQPQLIGVNVGTLNELGAFQLSKLDETLAGDNWEKLESLTASNAVPAIVDETTMMWALKKKVGDTFLYQNETGQDFRVQIVGTIKESIFQGYLLVDEGHLLREFPSNPGYSMFLVDVLPETDVSEVRNRIESASTDQGGKVDLSRDILASFHEIENTYIAIFNVLGSLGVVLGSLGLTIVVARSIQERLGEFSVMTAIGISRKLLGRLVYSEYSRLVAWGLLIGLIASGISVWPNLQTLPAVPTAVLVVGLLTGIVVLNLLCGVLAFKASFPKTGVGLNRVDR